MKNPVDLLGIGQASQKTSGQCSARPTGIKGRSVTGRMVNQHVVTGLQRRVQSIEAAQNMA
jgi:hypothetical protein